ncbi:ATP-binding protein [Variovorax ginsengisoli]|uniref:histidine kinase n=1 Tax=Variovorax ginsengisoli TaxID=363844 RepID=A0ABT8SDX0_9BURK|nr:ATP-binding protein [Variovorax ginsengisoli]MDN8617755.1 ATP-binding protein [Variovorax ginsengisoli]MDO1536925.1 ATP-binding protein [Variovorax ginsengisoli]
MKSGDRLRRWIIAAGVLLVAAFTASAVYDSWRLHQQIMLANERELGNLAKALAEQGSRNLQAVDLLLRDTADWYETTGRHLPPDAISAALAARVVGISQVSVLTLVDAQGMQRHRSRTTGEPLADVSDRPYFQNQRERPSGDLYINEPVVTRSERLPALVVSRRLSTPEGRFDGVVTAIVTLQQIQAAYSAIHLGDGSALVLTLDDGTLVVRQPEIAGFDVTRRFPELPRFKGAPLVDRSISPIDGSAKLVAAVGVGKRPMTLSIIRDEEEALRPWHDEVRSAIIRTLLLTGLVVLTIAGLLHQLRRLETGEAEKAALQARLQKAERLESLGTLAGGIAHDFNNILGAILGFGEMAQRHAEPGSDMRRHLDRVMQAGARARVLVRRILDFSRSGVAERKPVHIQAVVEEAIAMLRPTLPESICFEARLEAGAAAVMGDGTQLYQVVMNLCTNASQAIVETGVIEVRLERMRSSASQHLLHGDIAAGDYVRFIVSDTGRGMSADVLQRAFDPFFTTKKVGEGTGLGLSMVHGIVSDLGGAIDIQTEPGHGTCVAVWLPISGEFDAQAQRPDPAWPRGSGQVVMVVDDERPLVELAEELLAELGYEPVGFESSERALEAFTEDPQRFDAVLTDEMLPGMPGSELVRQLQAIRPGLPVILVSGNVDATLEQRARDAGVIALLRKPLALRELAETLALTLGRE